MNANAPIGVFDSGVGGLTVLRALREHLPHESFIYLGDTARLPYGTKGAQTITRYAVQATQFLINQGVKMIIVACNTASAFALTELQKQFPHTPILGVIEAGAKAACNVTQTGSIIVIATEGTTQHGAYEKAIYAHDPQLRVFSKACSLFVALAEEGWLKGPVVESIIAEYLTPLLKECQDADTLVLGCTHFPTLKQAIQEVVGEKLKLVDAGEVITHWVQHTLSQFKLITPATAEGKIQFLATDSPQRFARVATHFLGETFDPTHIAVVDL